MKEIFNLGINFAKVLIGSLMNPHAMVICIIASIVFLISVFVWYILYNIYSNSANKLITVDVFTEDIDYNDKKVKKLYMYNILLLVFFYTIIISFIVAIISGFVILVNV